MRWRAIAKHMVLAGAWRVGLIFIVIQSRSHLNQLNASMACLVCGGQQHQRKFKAREQLLGSNELFDYLQCRACGSLQIAVVPLDLTRYYPSDYYSMLAADEPIASPSRLKRFVRAARTDYYINRANPLGWAIDKYAPKYFDLSWEWFRGYASTRSRILDVGCGYGDLLRQMRWRGFRHLTGIDPFIEGSIEVDGLRIIRGALGELDEAFDFVMLHHSLEHMPDPLGALGQVRRLLRRGGTVLVRVPVAGSWADQHYRVNWIGLDPPRHLFVPSREGMSELARRAGFFVARYWCDSNEGDLLSSESFARGFSPYDREKKTWIVADRFSASEIEQARERAADLNRAEDGDRGCFILRGI
jgi:SAM-dependent methyltransferase